MPNNALAGFTSPWTPNPVAGSDSFQADFADAIQRIQQNLSALQLGPSLSLSRTGKKNEWAPYPVSVMVSGLPSVGQVFYIALFGIAVSFADGWPGSIAVALTRPTTTAMFSLTQQTSSGQVIPVGSLAIQPSGQPQINGSAATFLPGDLLTLTAPTPKDVTLANILMTFYGRAAVSGSG